MVYRSLVLGLCCIYFVVLVVFVVGFVFYWGKEAGWGKLLKKLYRDVKCVSYGVKSYCMDLQHF